MHARYRPLLPTLLLAACCLSTLVFWLKGTTTDEGAPANYVLSAKHYGAFAATSATLAAFFFCRHYYKYFLALTLLLGMFGLLNFIISETNVSVAFGPLRISISLVVAAIGLITYILYASRVNAKLLALAAPSDEKIRKVQQQEIATFKERFARKSTEELAAIVAANALVPTAVAAARQLLAQRD
ncbi:hypothetical protein GCM10027594_22420 [Hymenobacter agri]